MRIPLGETVRGWSRTMVVTLMLATALLAVFPLASTAIAATQDEVSRVADELTTGGGSRRQSLNKQELRVVADELVRQNGGQPLDPNDRENLLALADEIFERQPSKTGQRPSESQLRDVAEQLAQSNAADQFSDGGADTAGRVAAEAGASGGAVADDQPDAEGDEGVFTRIGRFFGGLFT